jgi:hypothetical protein
LTPQLEHERQQPDPGARANRGTASARWR